MHRGIAPRASKQPLITSSTPPPLNCEPQLGMASSSTSVASTPTDSTAIATTAGTSADITSAGTAAVPTMSTSTFTEVITFADTSAEANTPSSTMQMMQTSANVTSETTTMPPDNLPIIIGCSVAGAVLLILLIILITYCVMKVKKKRAFEGKYSPSANEQKGGVQMNDIMTIIQPPLPERLI